jgi:hypothetical protein
MGRTDEIWCGQIEILVARPGETTRYTAEARRGGARNVTFIS